MSRAVTVVPENRSRVESVLHRVVSSAVVGKKCAVCE